MRSITHRYNVARAFQTSFHVVLLGLVFLFVGQALAWQETEPPAKAEAAKTKPPPAKSIPKPSPASKSKTTRAEEPKMLTKSEADARKRSPFLRPPGSTGEAYDAEDVRDLPPWSRTSVSSGSRRGGGSSSTWSINRAA